MGGLGEDTLWVIEGGPLTLGQTFLEMLLGGATWAAAGRTCPSSRWHRLSWKDVQERWGVALWAKGPQLQRHRSGSEPSPGTGAVRVGTLVQPPRPTCPGHSALHPPPGRGWPCPPDSGGLGVTRSPLQGHVVTPQHLYVQKECNLDSFFF